MSKKPQPQQRPVGIKKSTMAKATRDQKFALQNLKKMKTTDKQAHDSYQNYALNLGLGTDNALSGSTYGFNPITRQRTLCEWVHRGSWLGGVAIDIVADDMTRAGVEIISDADPSDLEKIDNRITEMSIWPMMGDTIRWARLYGGAIGVYLVDGQDMRTPLNLERVGKGQFKGMCVLDRWMVDPSLEDLVTEFGPDLGKPKFYRVNGDAPGLRGKVIHYSRVFRMEGISLPYWQKVMENLWGISVLERIYDRMVAFDSATTGAAQLVYKSHLRNLKVKGFREIVAGGGKPLEGLSRYVYNLSRFQGIEGITVIDSEDDFQTVGRGTSGAGISEILSDFAQQLAGALETPLTRLLGQSPPGLNSSGDSEIITYYDGIKQKQERMLRIPVKCVYVMTAQSEGVDLGETFDFEFTPLWQMKEGVKADISARDTESVLSVDTAGILPEKTILQELRERGKKVGRWTNITDEMIDEASDQVALPLEPIPGEEPQPGEGDPSETPPSPDGEPSPGMSKMPGVSGAGGPAVSPPKLPHLGGATKKLALDAVPLEGQPFAQAYYAGSDAFKAGQLETDNPHPAGTKLNEEWWRGYKFMRKQVRFQSTISARRDKSRDGLPTGDFGGLPIVVETKAGERRWHDGPVMPADYGYIRRVPSAEGPTEWMDCFIGPHSSSRTAWVVDMLNPNTGVFDEHKIMLGFSKQAEAVSAFREAYDGMDGHRWQRWHGATTQMDLDSLEFKQWIATGDKSKPMDVHLERRKVA